MKHSSLKKIIFSSLIFLGCSSLSSVEPYEGYDFINNDFEADCGRWSFEADWLYWRAEEDNLNYGIILHPNNTGNNPSDIDVRFLHPEFKNSNGYRLAAEYEFPCDGWGLGVIYSYLPTSSHFSFIGNTDPDNLSFAQFPAPNFIILNFLNNTNVILLKSDWQLNTSYLDIDIDKNLCLTNVFNIRPHMGIRLLWMRQHFSLEGTGENNSITSEFVTSFNQKMFGIGIEGGLWADWKICGGFSLIGHMGGSIMCSNFRNIGKEDITSNDPNSPPEQKIHYKDHIFEGTPSLDYFLGLQYCCCLWDMDWNVRAGWEEHVFFDVNQMTIDGGNLTLQGLTLGAVVGF